jgi:hypothetical protein
LGPVFMFCAPGLVFGGNKGVGSRFSCFARPDSFSAVPRALDPVFMFCAPVIVFGDTGGVWSRFHVLRFRTRFWRYWGRQVPFYCFALLDSFSAVLKESGLVFMFCAPGLVFDGTVGVGSRFHVLLSRNRFRLYRRRRDPFSCFALPDSFSAVQRASGPIFMFCDPGIIYGGDECVGSRCHVLRSRIRFRRYRRHRVPFSCFAPPESFSPVPSVGSRFHVLRLRTHFRRYRRRRVSFSYFALPESFSTVLRASGPVFMFCA